MPVEDLEIEEDSSEDEIDIDDIVVQEYVKVWNCYTQLFLITHLFHMHEFRTFFFYFFWNLE